MDFLTILQSFLEPFSLHPYIFIFIGLFFFGETVFFPSLYLAFRGTFDTSVIIGLMISAALLSDLVWYALGRSLARTTVIRIIGSRASRVMEGIASFFIVHRLKTLYISKFVYGTRTVVQVMSGMYKTPFWRYLFVNILGTASLALCILLLAYATNMTLQTFTGMVHVLEVSFLIFVVVVVLIHLCIRHVVLRHWLKP